MPSTGLNKHFAFLRPPLNCLENVCLLRKYFEEIVSVYSLGKLIFGMVSHKPVVSCVDMPNFMKGGSFKHLEPDAPIKCTRTHILLC